MHHTIPYSIYAYILIGFCLFYINTDNSISNIIPQIEAAHLLECTEEARRKINS